MNCEPIATFPVQIINSLQTNLAEHQFAYIGYNLRMMLSPTPFIQGILLRKISERIIAKELSIQHQQSFVKTNNLQQATNSLR